MSSSRRVIVWAVIARYLVSKSILSVVAPSAGSLRLPKCEALASSLCLEVYWMVQLEDALHMLSVYA